MADAIAEHLLRYNREFHQNLTKEDLRGKRFWQIVPEPRHQALDELLRAADFFEDLDVMPDSPRVLAELQRHYEVFIASAAMEVPSSFNPKYRWLQRHFPTIPHTHIVFCGDKSILRADYLIDDNPRQLEPSPARHPLRRAPQRRRHRLHPRPQLARNRIPLPSAGVESSARSANQDAPATIRLPPTVLVPQRSMGRWTPARGQVRAHHPLAGAHHPRRPLRPSPEQKIHAVLTPAPHLDFGPPGAPHPPRILPGSHVISAI